VIKLSTTQPTTNQQQLTSDITIHNMEPVGCWNWCDPLHRTLTVANPKSPIFTVRLSVRKMSIEGARLKNTNPRSSHSYQHMHKWEWGSITRRPHRNFADGNNRHHNSQKISTLHYWCMQHKEQIETKNWSLI